MTNQFDKNARICSDLCVAAHRAYSRGIQTGSGGNLSARTADSNAMIVKSSGGSFIDCKENGTGFVSTDFFGNVLDGSNQKPTREVFLHGLLYRLCPDARAVVHTHSPWTISWSYSHDVLPKVTYHAELKIQHEIPVVHIPSPMVREEDEPVIRSLFEQTPNLSAFVLAGHGIVTIGKNAAAAEHLAELIEETAQIAILKALLEK